MNNEGMPRVRRLRARALGTSALALAASWAGTAAAQCAPEPTVAGRTTTCTGTDADGLTVTTNSPVVVAAGATVRAGAGGPGAVTLAAPSGTGSTVAQLDNSGAITSATGLAIAPQGNAGSVGLTTLNNRAGATISGVAGGVGVTVQALTNAGRIDGGTGGAYALPTVTGTVLFPSTVTNSGTMTSAGAGATLQLRFGSVSVSNSGRLENTGTGAVIDSGTNSLSVGNAAGGVITAVGVTALRSDFQLRLVNAGTVTGSVLGGSGFPDYVDNRAGTINGDVRLGGGDDQLIARIGATQLVDGITGTIDGGTGTDVLELIVGADRTLTGATVLPTGFEVLQLDLANNARLTVANTPPAGGYYLRGNGTVAIGADITTTGRVLNPNYVQVNLGLEALNFVNDRTVTTTLTTPTDYAIRLNSVANATNSGTITALGGNGVQFQTNGGGASLVTNSGTITAVGSALQASGRISNTGTVRSTGGVAVSNDLGGGGVRSLTSINSGRVEGATTGYALSSMVLVNTGGISATGGVGVSMSGASLDNRAGGTVSGTQAAIRTDGFFANYVANAGAITGNVDFGSASPSSSAADWFIDRGGSVTGSVLMGGGDDVFVAQLGRANGGVSGTIDGGAGFDTFRYATAADASAVIAPRATFEAVGYQVSGGARLVLTAAGPVAVPLTLSGTGSVDVTADLSGGTRPLLDLTQPSLPAFSGLGEDRPVDQLSVVSRGAVNLAVTTRTGVTDPTAVRVGTATFENAGTIGVSNAAGTGLGVVGIAGGFGGTGAITNSGTITLSGTGVTAVSNGASFTNTGRITGDAGTGSAAAVGVAGVATVVNSGTIDVSGSAVVLGSTFGVGGSLTNSGTLAGTTVPAVRGDGFGGVVENQAGGTITGRTAVALRGGTVVNAGTINGTVQLTIPPAGGVAFDPGAFVSAGGTVNGSVLFGAGNDLFLQLGEASGVTGRIVAGDGFDVYGRSYAASATGALGLDGLDGFEAQLVQARGSDTTVTLTAAQPVADTLYVGGDGRIVNRATVNGTVQAALPFFGFGALPAALGGDLTLSEFRNEGVITGGFEGSVRAFTNAGTVGDGSEDGFGADLNGRGDFRFANTGLLIGAPGENAADLSVGEAGTVSVANDGEMRGGLEAFVSFDREVETGAPRSLVTSNTGTITAAEAESNAIYLSVSSSAGGSVTLTNSGTLSANGAAGRAAVLELQAGGPAGGTPLTYAVTNSGLIEANGGGTVGTFFGTPTPLTEPASALGIVATGAVGTVTNAATGRVTATGPRSTAVGVIGGALDLVNAGTITGGAGTLLDADDALAAAAGTRYLAGAVQALGLLNDRVLNTGTVTGSIDLGAGDDRVENRGTINGDVFLRAGNDTFVQLASATLNGTADGGEGDDLFTVDATGGGAVNGDQFVNFERFTQVGSGNVAYSGRFRFDTITLAGSTLNVARGQVLATDGPTTVTGTDAAETVENDGTIAGNVSLLGGDDRVVNRGTIGGSVFLGDGDDSFVEGAGSSVAGVVDGGAGSDLYTVMLAGDRTGIGRRTGFERLAVRDAGTLTLTLDGNLEQLRLLGSGVNLSLGGFSVGRAIGSDGTERLALDGDVPQVSLLGGDDLLALGFATAAGAYDGGAGADVLRFAAAGPATLSGSAVGFERVELAGGALTVSGTLGSAGAPLAFGDGAQSLTVARGGTLAGAVDLGAGDDALRLAAGSSLGGTVAGGAGTDTAAIELAGDRTLGAVLTGFERLTSEGTGTLTLAGAQSYAQVDAGTNLSIATGSSLVSAVRFGVGDQRFAVAGGFAGSVDGGAGTDSITVSGGTEATPVAFSTVAGVEAFAMTGGFATMSGTAALGSVDLSGGRLVGLSGSTLTAAQFRVAAGATFGSAGTVNGNLQVAGSLSPGASPGTMTVNGNVALLVGSVSLFELTPTVSDRLVVNGAVSIAPGATLRLVTTGTITPGTSFELVTASAGITGSYTTVERPASLFGALVQDANRIRLLGQFLAVSGASPQVARSVDYANAVIASGRATPGFLAAVPALLGANGASNAAAFARLTPEPYATATQAGVDDALALVSAARGPAFAASREDPGLFTFGQGLANWHRLGADRAQGSSAASARGYGFLGGIGYGSSDWSAGVFGGWLDTHQSVGALGARTSSDGFVAGAHARWAPGPLRVTASVLYDGGDATTRRAVPGGTAPAGRYDLTSWVSDLSASYALGMGSEWALSPRVGLTYLRTTRGSVAEAGGPFALTVARDRHRAGFADAGVGVGRAETSEAAFRPYASLGVRYQLDGRATRALASYAGGPLGLVAIAADRARAVATAAAGLSMRVTEALDLFSTASAQQGRDDHQEAVSTGVRLRF